MTPSSWPITTFSLGRSESRSKASPFSGSPSRPCRPPGSPRVSSSTTRCRLACSASAELASARERRRRSAGCGSGRSRSTCPPSTGASQVQPERLRLAQTHQTSPVGVDVPAALGSTGTIARSAREKPEGGPAGHADRVLEVERVVADPTAVGPHAPVRPVTGQLTCDRRPPRRSVDVLASVKITPLTGGTSP